MKNEEDTMLAREVGQTLYLMGLMAVITATLVVAALFVARAIG